MNEPPKFKWGSLILLFLFFPLLFIGIFVANGDTKIWQYFVRISGCGVVFFLVKFFADNWENMTWESEDDDSDDDE